MLEPVREALRGFRQRRVVAVTIVLTLGIGANSAIFSMVDAVLLRQLPSPAPDRLVAVYELNRGLKQATQLVAPVRLEEWNRASRSIAALAGTYFENMTDTSGELPERVEAMRVSPRFFTVLGVSAAIGRTLTPQEEVFGGPRAIVLSDAYWRKRFNDRHLDTGAICRRHDARAPGAPVSHRGTTASRRHARAGGGRSHRRADAFGRAVPGNRQGLGRVAVALERGNSRRRAPLNSKALVTRAFADRFFPDMNPIGHALTAPWLPPGQQVGITGIVGDVRESGLARASEPLIYWCGYSPCWPDAHFIVRTGPSRPLTVAAIRAALLEIEPKRALYSARPLTETLSESVSQQRLTMVLLALFAATALLLAAMDLYGVLSQLVAARRREIGVRIALGARASQIVASVAAQAAAVTGVGICVGFIGALVLARFMATLVFGIATRDPLTFIIVPLVLAAVAVIAALVPARRAATTDPMTALRDE